MGVHVNFDLTGELGDHVKAMTKGDGWYASVEEYVRDLIRKDVEAEYAKFELFRAELQAAFAEPEDNYRYVTAEDVIARNGLRD